MSNAFWLSNCLGSKSLKEQPETHCHVYFIEPLQISRNHEEQCFLAWHCFASLDQVSLVGDHRVSKKDVFVCVFGSRVCCSAFTDLDSFRGCFFPRQRGTTWLIWFGDGSWWWFFSITIFLKSRGAKGIHWKFRDKCLSLLSVKKEAR